MTNHISTTLGALLLLTMGLAACSPGGSPASAGASPSTSSAAPSTAAGSGSLTFSAASSDMSGDTTTFTPDTKPGSSSGIFRPSQDGVFVAGWTGLGGKRTIALSASGTKAVAGETYDLTPSTQLKTVTYVDNYGTNHASSLVSESGTVTVSAGSGTGLTLTFTNVKMHVVYAAKGSFTLNGTLQNDVTRLPS
jgi:hypothetical protein